MPEQNTPEMVKAQVACAGVSYFTKEYVTDPNGERETTEAGVPISSVIRHEALRGDVIELSQSEYDRLSALGALREPSDAPLHPEFPVATPFGVPLRDADDELRAFAGPVMGDPRPTAGLSDTEVARGPAALTPDEAAELERKAAEGFNDESDAAISDRDYEAASKSSLQAEINRRNATRDEDDQIVVEGSGSGGNVVKDDLVAALEEDDEDNE